jgi:type III restriction enzyme
MSRSDFPEYDVDYISGVMSLRSPQKSSLRILDSILNDVELGKNINLHTALRVVNDQRRTCTDFERGFMSLTFALATGVGKTRLMGAFITYLFTVKAIRNFFVVAPNLTIYEKLVNDLGNSTHEKYVFKGVGCFGFLPNIVTGDNYDSKTLGYLGMGSINIYIFNISKFNSELVNIKNLSEILGESYFSYLSHLPDLVVLMDESHHYRANASSKAIDDLHPILGLELTATPHTDMAGKTVYFRNVVYDYPLGMALKDGYARIPYALSRRDIKKFNFTENEMDRMMLSDGIKHHENMKAILLSYAKNNQVRIVKPFALVVCKDTKHAESIIAFIKSNSFFDGNYRDKVIEIHSNQSGPEKEENIRLLLAVERSDNPIEIVIHVNILKEGWDVNNLYTIIPLRTAAAKTLREQTIGRGLRLPYGKLTDDNDVDSLIITAHDKFEEIIDEASKPNSLLHATNVIFAEDEDKTKAIVVDTNYNLFKFQRYSEFFSANPQIKMNDESIEKLEQIHQMAVHQVSSRVIGVVNGTISKTDMVRQAADSIRDEKDFSEIASDHDDLFKAWYVKEIDVESSFLMDSAMFIPQIRTTASGDVDYRFEDFDLRVEDFVYMPISNLLTMTNLLDPQDAVTISEKGLEFAVSNPKISLLNEIMKKPEIDYEKTSALLQKLISQVLEHLEKRNGPDEVKHIVMFNKKDIASKIIVQMMQHFHRDEPTLLQEVTGIESYIYEHHYTAADDKAKSLYEPIEDDETIRKCIFGEIRKAPHRRYKFDSNPERKFAIICEQDSEVLRWLRPAPQQFNLTYYGGKKYIPDFVIETKDYYYLVEIKGEDMLQNPDVTAKKKAAINYCKVASEYCKANYLKPWKHCFIPAKQVHIGDSAMQLLGSNLAQDV